MLCLVNVSSRSAAVTSAVDSSAFAVLALIPDSFKKGKSKKKIFRGRDGAILLFNGSDPKPVSIWTVMKVWQKRTNSLILII